MDKFIPINGLHHVAYRCRDAEETRHFYEDLLGLPLAHVVCGETVSTGEKVSFAHLFFEMTDGSYIAFFDLGDDQIAEPSPNTPRWVNHLALRVGSQAEVDRAKLRLEQAGVSVIGPVSHDGFVHSIYFFDPNGVRLELTLTMSGADEVQGFRENAHAACAKWMQSKQRRLAEATA